MKKTNRYLSLLVILTLLAACSPTASDEALLSVGPEEYSQSDLEAFGTITVSYTGKDGVATDYEGVVLADLLKDAGLTDTAATLVFVASDGFEAEATMEEILACTNCIVAFDDDILRMIMPDMSSKLQVKDVIQINTK